MDFIIHDSSGNILRYGSCSSGDFASQAQAGETALAVTYQPGTVVNGAIQPLTADQIAANVTADRKSKIAAIFAQRKTTTA